MILADGCFDPLHVGHVRYLRDAAALGSPLIVRIAPDDAIAAKGRTPFQSQQERALTVLALGCVDRIVLHQTLAEAIRDLKPRFLVKGPEWLGKLPGDVLAACQEAGTQAFFTAPDVRSSVRLA